MRETTRGILLGVVGTLAIVLGAAMAWEWASGRGVVLTDGGRIRVDAGTPRVRDVLWEPAELLPAWINQGDENYEPRPTPDGRALLLVRGKAGGGADVYGVERTTEGWGEPFPIEAINTPGADELGPALSADGRTLYFYSDRAGGLGGYDLWRSRRADDPGGPLHSAVWEAPENLGPEVNSPYNDYGPAPSPDGGRLYFSSNRPKRQDETSDHASAWPATVREDVERRDYDLYVSEIGSGGTGRATPLDALNTDANEGTPAVSPAGDFLYFASDRDGGAGGLDIYRARLSNGRPLRPENLGWPINTPDHELDPGLSMHGFALHFSSNRPQPGGASEPPGEGADRAGRYAVYSAVSREVYRERAPLLAGLDWGAAWAALWPWLLLLGLLALLLLLLRRLLRDEDIRRRWRTLGLLAKCLILSLLLHSVIAALLTVWYVSGNAGLIAGPEGTRVALVSRGVGAELAAQIRGELTDVRVEAKRPADLRARPDASTDLDTPEVRLETAAVAPPETVLVRAEPADSIESVAPSVMPSHPPETPTSTRHAAAHVGLPQPAPAEAREEEMFVARPDAVELTSTPASLAPIPVDTAPTPIRPSASAVADATLEIGVHAREAPDTLPAMAGPQGQPPLPLSRESAILTPAVPPIDAQASAQESSLAMPIASMSRSMPRQEPESPPEIAAALDPARVRANTDAPLVVPSAREAPPPSIGASISTSTAASEVPRAHTLATAATPINMTIDPDETLREPVEEQGAIPVPADLPVARARPETPTAMSGAVPAVIGIDQATRPSTDASLAGPIHTADRTPGTAMADPGQNPIAIALPAHVFVALPGLTIPDTGTERVSPETDAGARPLAMAHARPAASALPSEPATHFVIDLDQAAGAAAEGSFATVLDRGIPESSPGGSSIEIAAIVPMHPLALLLPGPHADFGVDDEQHLSSVEPARAIGTLVGTVRDVISGAAIARAEIRLELPDHPVLTARTNVRGEYRLRIPAIPDHVAVTAIAPDYTPAAIDIASDDLRRGTLRRDFELTPRSWNIVPIESDPQVRHLGNDEYDGTINSQFQRPTEGLVYVREFHLAALQTPPNIGRAELVVLVKGAQASNPVLINGRRVPGAITGSPRDGSFGELVLEFPAQWLVEGANTIEIRSVRGSSDLDDFEFVNPRIRLEPASRAAPKAPV